MERQGSIEEKEASAKHLEKTLLKKIITKLYERYLRGELDLDSDFPTGQSDAEKLPPFILEWVKEYPEVVHMIPKIAFHVRKKLDEDVYKYAKGLMEKDKIEGVDLGEVIEKEVVQELEFDDKSIEDTDLLPMGPPINLYEIDEEFNPEAEYVDKREGDEYWIEPEYESQDFISEPFISKYGTLEKNIVEFIYSLGYDSFRRNNLCVVDENTVIYLSGNYIHIYNVETGQFKYIRSYSGIGLGHVSKHPFEPIFAVGERGHNPHILLYSYPELKIIRVLRGGTEKFYNYVSFSANGEWLLSQGGEPDNSLAVWNWRFERLVIKQKCLGRDAWKVETNPYIVGGIITSGVSHIKFWTMAETFTGLKLRGSSGKFGSNEFCDICTFCALPKNMVLSPNSKRNVYVWEGEEIRMELKRRGGMSLHDDDIVYLEFKENYDEIFTVGLEGIYKVWDYTRIDYAKKSELYELELQPTFVKKFHDEMGVAHPMSFQRQHPNKINSEKYYMQDRSGSIWLVEMGVKEKLAPSKRVFLGHENPIGDIAPSPLDYYVATVGAEGKLHVYNMKKKKLIIVKYFGIGGTSLLWLPHTVDSTTTVLIMGFVDGTVRVVILSICARELNPKSSDAKYVNVIQAIKPHGQAITSVSFNPHRSEKPMVVTSSLDSRIFIHWLKPVKDYLLLEPYAFVEMPDPIHSTVWNTYADAILTTSTKGTMAEVSFPENLPTPASNSYRISLPVRISHFTSVKSDILRSNVNKRNLDRKLRRKEKREKQIQMQLEKEKRRREKREQKRLENKGNIVELYGKESIKEQLDKDRVESNERISMNYKLALRRIFGEDGNDEIDESKSKIVQQMKEKSFDMLKREGSTEVCKCGLKHEINLPANNLTCETFLEQEIELKDSEHGDKIEAFPQKEDDVSTAEDEYPKKDNKFWCNIKPLDKKGIRAAASLGVKKYIPRSPENLGKEVLNESEDESFYDESEDDADLAEDREVDVSGDEELPEHYDPVEPSPILFAKYLNEDCIWVSVGGYDVGYIYEYRLGENKPYKSTPVHGSNVEITCWTELFDGEFLILGLGNGAVKFIKSNPADFTDFYDYWECIMHDNMNGRIKKICATYDMRFLYSVGDDSNIFYYKINLPDSKFPDKKNLPGIIPPPLELNIDGFIHPETLSLEDSLIEAEKAKKNEMGESRKSILERNLANLIQRYTILVELNHGLPDSQRLPESFFIINKEFEEQNIQSITEKRLKMTRDLEIECLKSKYIRNKVYNYFIKPVKTFKIYLFGIELFNKVTTFYQTKLSLPFLQAENECEKIMVDILKKEDKWNNIFIKKKYKKPLKIFHQERPPNKYKRSKLMVRPLIKGEDQIVDLMERDSKALYSRLSKRRQRRKLLQNILTLFLEDKERKKQQFEENLKSRKVEHKDLMYVLKSDPNYKLNNLKAVTKERKFYQLVTTRRKIHDLISYFNSLVLKLREKKSKIVALYKASLKDGYKILSEFYDVELPSGSKKVSVFEPLEFPEVCFMDHPPEFPHEKELEQSYHDLLFPQLYEINKIFPICSDKFVEKKISKLLKQVEEIDRDLIRSMRETGFHTPWEQELIQERKQFLLSEYFKKGQILKDMIAEYDKELGKLIAMKVEYEIKIYYLKIFFIKYYEELQIIRNHELLEKDCDSKIHIFMKQKHIYILRIKIRKIRIEKCLEDINLCNKRFDKVNSKFLTTIAKVSPQHKRHLTRIFKKKWKPAKENKGDSDEDESEEEEDEEEEEEDEDAEDIDIEDLLVQGFTQVSEHDKPEGLDEKVFQSTFLLREERQIEEQNIYKKKTEIQDYNEQIDALRKNLLAINTFIAFYQAKLSVILEEKHKALSSVRTVVVLDASQMQHFDVENNTFPSVKETVLFPLYKLKNLEARKRKMKEDIIHVQLKKQETVKHVKRLDLDIHYLKQRLGNLRKQIKKEKLEKFGVPINLGQLEERTLLKLMKEFKYNTLPFHLRFHVDITKLQREVEKIQMSTGDQIKKNTYEQLKFGALLEQKRQFEDIVEKAKVKKHVEYLTIEEIRESIEELRKRLKKQTEERESLLHKINNLKYGRMAILPDTIEVTTETQDLRREKKEAEKLLDDDILEYEEGDEEYDSFDEHEKTVLEEILFHDEQLEMDKQKELLSGEDSPLDLTTEDEGEYDKNAEDFGEEDVMSKEISEIRNSLFETLWGVEDEGEEEEGGGIEVDNEDFE